MEHAIKLEGVCAQYGSHTVLQNSSLCIAQGTTHMLLGENGAGKTTLLKTINGLVSPQSGSVLLFGKKPNREMYASVAYIPQDMGLVDSLSVEENILMGALSRMGVVSSLLKQFSTEDRALASQIIADLGLSSFASRPVKTLSGGEKRRVAIARALMQQPKIILADEFLSSLDTQQVENVMDVVGKLKEKNTTIVLVEHNKSIAKKYGDAFTLVKEKCCMDITKDDVTLCEQSA